MNMLKKLIEQLINAKYVWLTGLAVLLAGHAALYGIPHGGLGFYLLSYLFAGAVLAALAWTAALAIRWRRPNDPWYVWANLSVGTMWGLVLSVRALGLGT